MNDAATATDMTELYRLMEHPAWHAEAACRGATNLFYGKRGDSQTIVQAKRICTTCKVRSKCFDYAMNNGELIGVWGGTSGEERRHLMLRRRRTVGTTPASEAS
jgi:WhiB family redox-sensing transcriptional regulator